MNARKKRQANGEGNRYDDYNQSHKSLVFFRLLLVQTMGAHRLFFFSVSNYRYHLAL